MKAPITISNGTHEVKIYRVRNRGQHVYQISYYEGGIRQRKTLGKVAEARQEAKLILGRLALTNLEVGELCTADMESYAIARKFIEPTGLPLHVCAETFASAHSLLAGVPLLEAVQFYRELHPLGLEVKKPLVLAEEFSDGRKAMGVSHDYGVNIKRQLGRLMADLPKKTVAEYRTKEVDDWMAGQKWSPCTKNDVRKIFIAFGNWLKKQGYLPNNRPTAFDGMMIYKETATKVAIYTPAELLKLLEVVKVEKPKLSPWLVCAAFTGARVAELDMLEWQHINFERGFVEVASKKVRTKARRLVPLNDALRAWLSTCRQTNGPINVYAAPQTILSRVAAEAGLTLKDNAFRHSYISYRLAEINDTARVALEAGNTPDIIFQHYRELVNPEEAVAWFGIVPPEITPLPSEDSARTLLLAA